MAERRDRRDRGPKEESQFDERVVSIDRVARVVKGGRRFRFRALVVVGDKKGSVGAGTAKGADVTAAVSKATEAAKKKLVRIHVTKDGTIAHEQEAKVSGAHVLVKPASPGTGLIAGGVVRIVLEVAGIKNALSKSIGSSNKINITKATLDALRVITPRDQWHTTKHSLKSAPKKAAKATVKKTVEAK